MRRGIVRRHVAVFRLDQHAAIGIDEDGRERMISVRHGAAGDSKAVAQEMRVARLCLGRAIPVRGDLAVERHCNASWQLHNPEPSRPASQGNRCLQPALPGAPNRTVGQVAMAANADSKVAVYAALAGNLLVACTKIIAAIWTGSSAMMSEAIHSVVDPSNELLLLYGFHRASRPPDRLHPLGYGRELYFWSFIVALLLFALGAGVSLYQGVDRIMHPYAMVDPLVNIVVLSCSSIFEGYSWWMAHTRFAAAKGGLSYWEAVRRSKDPPTFLVLFEDSAALLGLAIALLGTFAAQYLGDPIYDGLASIAIGLLLAGVGAVIA